MSSDDPKDNEKVLEAFACDKEASALLNCVTDSKYNEHKCLPLIKKLRDCVKRKGVVQFSLLPDRPDGIKVLLLGGVYIGVCLTAGQYIMYTTNPEIKSPEAEHSRLKEIRSNQSGNAKLMASQNREALRQMFEELKSDTSEERYKAALSGKILNNRRPSS